MFLEFMVSKFFFLFTTFAGLCAYIGFVRFHNWSTKLGWSDSIWPAIKDDPKAVGDYYGKVRLGMCILIGCGMLAGAIV